MHETGTHLFNQQKLQPALPMGTNLSRVDIANCRVTT
jgi:hypothetical protein